MAGEETKEPSVTTPPPAAEGAETENPTSFAEAVAIGALAPGVNAATLVALNAAFAAAALALCGLLCLLLFAERPPGSTAAAQAAVLVPHAAVALVLTVLLGAAVNLLVSATGGVVGVGAQREALFGKGRSEEEGEERDRKEE